MAEVTSPSLVGPTNLLSTFDVSREFIDGSSDQSHRWFIASPRFVIASGQAIVLPGMHDYLAANHVNPVRIQVRNSALEMGLDQPFAARNSRR